MTRKFDEEAVRAALATYTLATAKQDEHQRMVDEYADDRATALLAMKLAGLSYDEIGKLIGKSAARVGQIVSKARQKPRPEAADERAAALERIKTELRGGQ